MGAVCAVSPVIDSFSFCPSTRMPSDTLPQNCQAAHDSAWQAHQSNKDKRSRGKEPRTPRTHVPTYRNIAGLGSRQAKDRGCPRSHVPTHGTTEGPDSRQAKDHTARRSLQLRARPRRTILGTYLIGPQSMIPIVCTSPGPQAARTCGPGLGRTAGPLSSRDDGCAWLAPAKTPPTCAVVIAKRRKTPVCPSFA